MNPSTPDKNPQINPTDQQYPSLPNSGPAMDTPGSNSTPLPEAPVTPQQAPIQPTPISAAATPVAPTLPTPPQPNPVPSAPVNVMPPQQIPAVPAPVQPQTTPNPFSVQPAQATSAAPASYSPASTHVSDEITNRIAETPMLSSSDIAKQPTDKRKLRNLLAFLALFAGAIYIAAFLINQFIFQSYYVEGTSMTPTLQNNDRLIISKVEKTWSGATRQSYVPTRGQIVVLDSSIVGVNGQTEQLIKRVIGLPGDHIHIENGSVTITNNDHKNGYDVDKDLGLTYLPTTYVESPVDLTVPTDQVFVMGDNRAQNGSYDSRAFGPIDCTKIEGRLWSRILPLDKMQLF